MLSFHARLCLKLDGCQGPYAVYCSCLLAYERQMQELTDYRYLAVCAVKAWHLVSTTGLSMRVSSVYVIV